MKLKYEKWSLNYYIIYGIIFAGNFQETEWYNSSDIILLKYIIYIYTFIITMRYTNNHKIDIANY